MSGQIPLRLVLDVVVKDSCHTIDLLGHNNFVAFFAFPLDAIRIQPVEECKWKGIQTDWLVVWIIRDEAGIRLIFEKCKRFVHILYSVTHIGLIPPMSCLASNGSTIGDGSYLFVGLFDSGLFPSRGANWKKIVHNRKEIDVQTVGDQREDYS